LSTFFYLLILISIGVITLGLYKKAEITFSPILRIVVGSLYSYTDYVVGREHTFQVCILVLSITVTWIET